jgi:glutaredoxin
MKASARSMFGLLALIVAVGALNQWWSNRQAGEIGAQVAALVRLGDIRMLSSDTCSICVSARAWFKQNGIAYSECSIERDATCRADFEALRAPGTPVIVVRGRAQIGFSPERLRQALAPAG